VTACPTYLYPTHYTPPHYTCTRHVAAVIVSVIIHAMINTTADNGAAARTLIGGGISMLWWGNKQLGKAGGNGSVVLFLQALKGQPHINKAANDKPVSRMPRNYIRVNK